MGVLLLMPWLVITPLAAVEVPWPLMGCALPLPVVVSLIAAATCSDSFRPRGRAGCVGTLIGYWLVVNAGVVIALMGLGWIA